MLPSQAFSPRWGAAQQGWAAQPHHIDPLEQMLGMLEYAQPGAQGKAEEQALPLGIFCFFSAAGLKLLACLHASL